MSVNAPNDKLGWKAPDFKLNNTDNNVYTLDALRGKNGTVIAFICNHCPYVIAIAERLSFEAKELKKSEINTIAIIGIKTIINDLPNKEAGINFLIFIFNYRSIYIPFL